MRSSDVHALGDQDLVQQLKEARALRASADERVTSLTPRREELAAALADLESQIVQGKKPVSDWTAAVQTWKSSGGDTMRSELEKAFAEAAGK